MQKINAPGPYRALLLFHHIRMPKKISAFHKWSEELELQGLLKVGYPGLCLITDRSDVPSLVPEFIRRVKRLSWYTCELREHGHIDARSIDALHYALLTHDTPTSLSRRSGIVQLERLKEVSAYLQVADDSMHTTKEAKKKQTIQAPPASLSSWLSFYRNAMRP